MQSTVKKLDMPEGNGMSAAYLAFAGQVARGRSVAMIPVLDISGKPALYSCSGVPEVDLDEKTSLRHCIHMVMRARDAAEREGNRPIPV